ncbi:hypothetical protein Trydic_g13738 [Trypoxylus dichotomus]
MKALLGEEVEKTRSIAQFFLISVKRLTPKLRKGNRRAITDLRSDKNRTIMFADIRNVNVIMDVKDYKEKMQRSSSSSENCANKPSEPPRDNLCHQYKQTFSWKHSSVLSSDQVNENRSASIDTSTTFLSYGRMGLAD